MTTKDNQTIRNKQRKQRNDRKNNGRSRNSGKFPQRNSHNGWKEINFIPVSAEVIFKTIVLLMILLVAAVAMVNGITDAAVWAFLTMIAGYVAFSNPPSHETKK